MHETGTGSRLFPMLLIVGSRYLFTHFSRIPSGMAFAGESRILVVFIRKALAYFLKNDEYCTRIL